jgi:hypothetical protein
MIVKRNKTCKPKYMTRRSQRIPAITTVLTSIQRMPNLVRPHQYGTQLGEEVIIWGHELLTFFEI